MDLFKYLDTNCGMMDRKLIAFRRKIIEFLKEFIIFYSSYCIDYLEYIRKMCIALYRAEQSLVLKEKILMLTAKTLDIFSTELIENIYQPKTYIEVLLDEIKLNKLTCSIKGCIWYIIGILIGKFSLLLSDYKLEVHDVIFNDFKVILTQKKFEFKSATGILKSYMYLLEDPHLKSSQINELYIYLKSLINPLSDANSIKINKLALEVLSTHGKMFTTQLKRDSLELFDAVFDLCNHKNYELKMAANEAIEKISMHISDCLLEDSSVHKDIFRYLVEKIKNVLERKNSSLLINTAISLIGIFSNAIVRFMGEVILTKYLEELIVLCDKEIITTLGREAYRDAKQVTNYDNFKPSKSIKHILSIQKQYISLLNSYSNIIANLPSLSELVVKHFYNVLILGFSIHSRFYEKYKERFTESIAGIIVNMVRHQNFFWSFLRKVVKNGFIESIKMTQNMIFKENIEEVSITNAIKFWVLLFTRDKAFTEFTVTKLFDQLFTEINSLVDNLNISYIEKINETNDVYYEANNVDDLEIFNRTGMFLNGFINCICDQRLYGQLQKLFTKWVIILVKHFSRLANEYPRIAICYTVLSSLMRISESMNYFNRNNKQNFVSFLSEFKAFNLAVVKKIEIFQDELLLNSIEFLLSIPTELMKEIYQSDIKTLKYLFIKSFEIGFNDLRYAKLALKALKKFFANNSFFISSVSVASNSFISDKLNQQLSIEEKQNKEMILNEILPIFGQYLSEYEKIKESLDSSEIEKIEKYSKIQNKIFNLLGSIGGEAHRIIPSSEVQKNNLLSIINTKKINYFFPLYNKKYSVFFDNLLIKISDMALNSVVKEKKFAACELLHSLILYIIGKATEDLDNTLIFLMEKILFLACDLEKGISIIFETLLLQIIHWMSKKGNLKENKDIISMLDIIIECTSSRKNLKLRELSSDCLREYIKWFIKQHTDYTIKEKSGTIKYLIRKIESNSLHPDPFKRLGSSLCFEKILPIIGSNDFLIDKFLLEIVFYLVSILRICHNSIELNEFVFQHCLNSLDLLFKGIKSKTNLLIKHNSKRNLFKDLREVFEYFHSVFICNEIECSFAVQKMTIDLFNLIGRDLLKSESLVHYFNKNDLWPVLSENVSVANYQYIYFLLNNNLVLLSEIGIKYTQYSLIQLIQNLASIINEIMTNEAIEKKISFVYIISILKISKEAVSSYLFDGLIKKTKNNSLENMFDVVQRLTNKDIKYFIINKYNNILFIFIDSIKELTGLLLTNNHIPLIERIERYLTDQCVLFRDYSDETQLNDSCSKNEKCIEFFFWLLSNIYPNMCRNSNTIIKRLKSNFSRLLENTQPKSQLLVKFHFCFLFNQDFNFITMLLSKSQFYFDYLADLFFSNLLSSTEGESNDKQWPVFFKECCINNSKLVIILILFERAALSKKAKLTKIISDIFLSSLIKMENLDAIVNQIKIATLILINIIDNYSNSIMSIDDAFINIIDMYISQKSINIIKEILNLLGLIVKLGNKKHKEMIKVKYITIQSRYFPVNTKCLVANTKEWNDFQLIFNCLLNTFKTVETFEFLEILFPILREEKTEYSHQVKRALKNYLNNAIKTNNIIEIQKTIDVFLNKSSDTNLRDNIRFTIMRIITFKFLKKCSCESASQLFIRNIKQFEDMMKVNESTLQTNEEKFLLILEKTTIYKFIQLALEKIPTDIFKNDIHKEIYGTLSQGNEITKFLIAELHNSKRKPINNWEQICKQLKFSDYNNRSSNQVDTELYIKKTENNFYCSAYTSLCVLIKLTQIKEDIFSKFLFTTFRDKNEQLFDLLVSSHFTYNFPIETNFQFKTVQPKLPNSDNEKQGANKKLLIDEIITDSFFHDAYGASIKESLAFTQNNFPLDFINKFNSKTLQLKPNIDALIKAIPLTIEEDYVNKHPIMKHLLIILDYMNTLFPPNDHKLPSHLQLFLNEIKRTDLNVNLKIFFIKVIINKRELFNPYMNHFFSFLMKFSIEKNSCGKGFNYFLRDIATCLLSCDKLMIDHSKENIELVSLYVNTLIKLSGDTKNIIFRTNLKIVNDLMEKFGKIIFLNKKTLIDMITFDEKKQSSHIWKITAVQILASALEYDISIGDDDIYSYSNDKKRLFLKSLEKHKEIVALLIKLCESHRTPVQSASIEVLAKILSAYHKEDKLNDSIYITIYDYLSLIALGKNDKQTVNAIFRASMHFPYFVERKEIFNHSLQLIKNANQKQRNLILNSFICFITEIVMRLNESKSKNVINDKSYVDDCYYSLYQFTEVIFVDPNDELILNCVGLLNPMIKMKEQKYTPGLLRIVKKIQKEIRRKEDNTREVYYSFLFELFNQNYDEALEKEILNYIIINFDCEQNKELLKLMIQFINKNIKIPSHPAERLTYLMIHLSKETIESEGKFIQFLIKMIMILIYNSGDFELKIYDKGIEECVYKDLNINTSGYYLNRSQPIAPSIAIRNSMSEAYETLLSANQFEMTQANMIKASINPNSMDIDKDNNSNVIQSSASISMSQRDLTLSQYSSLVNTTANYPSMKTENKLVNFGLTHGEAFKMPDPIQRKKKKGYNSFLTENDMSYTPIENTAGNNIRFVPEGANRKVKRQKELSEEILVHKWLYRENEIRKKQVKLMRQYRDGDLPDIQIKNKDILEPLFAVCTYNSDISSELFLELMASIYKESMEDNKSNRQLEQNIEMILKDHKLSNYLVVSCLHRLILSFMKENGDYSPQLSLIKHSGLYSKNYHSSILIFEEAISQKKKIIENDVKMLDDNLFKKKKKLEISQSSLSRNSKCDIILTEDNKNAWINLLQFYLKMKIEDYQIGLMQNFSYLSELFVKDSSDFLSSLSSWMAKPRTIMNRNINKTNLLKAGFNITGITIDPAIDALRVKYSPSLFKDEALMEVIEDYAISSCSDLGEWDELSSYLSNKPSLSKPDVYKENPDKITALLKSWVYTSSKELMELMDFINAEISEKANTIYKTFTENSFAYYLSLYYINQKNFDKAFLYHQKAKSHLFKTWLNLGTFCYDLKHEVVQSIQKLYEVGEFLSFIRGTSASNPNLSFGQEIILSDDGNKNVVSLFDHWLNRWPSYLYDDSSAFHEVFSARKLINNTMKQKIVNYEQIISLNPILDTFIPRSLIEIAKCLYKKNNLDLAEVNIKTALMIRKENSYTNSYIVYPVMKNKFKIYQIETSTSNISYKEIESNYQKFLQILNNQLKTLTINTETKEKLLILQVKILLNLAQLSKRPENQSNFHSYFQKAKANFDEEELKLGKNQEFINLYLKLLRPMIKFCDGMIRNETYKTENETFYNMICQQYMECGLKALIMNDLKMSNIIPKIFDLLSKNQTLLGNIFTSYSKDINVDYYFKWKNQLIAYINTPIADLIQPIIQNILLKDSQSLFYTFTTVEMYHEIFLNPHKKTKLFFYLKDFYSKYGALNGFVEALDGLTHPEHRLTFWMKQIASVLENFIEKGDMNVTVNSLQNILEVMRYDVFNTNKKYINKKIGSYNAKFAQDCMIVVNNILTIENFKKLINKQISVSADIIKDFGKMIEPINIMINKNTSSQYNEGIEKLATFSEWLAQYECNDFTKSESYISLPTTGPERKVIISSFDQHIIILPSIRRPKRLVVYGNDEKSYLYLVKGCEDIRLDQRIEEVFKVCNDILNKDSNCTKKKIKLNVFDVIPITQKLGLIEWVNNTQPLLGVIKYSMENIFNIKNWQLSTSVPQIARAKWYSQFNSDNRAPSIQLQHVVALHSKSRSIIVNGLQAHENLLPKTILKRALEHYLLTPEEILISRIQFMRNYSVLSIACYILGIGDRHLDNFLLNIYSSEIVAIDFGVAFGQGILQAIPELVPFRLTSQIKNVIYPFGLNGVIRQTMIDCLSAFKMSKDYILDYCEVFVKEPLLDWIKRSKSGLSDFVGSHSSDMNLNWLPMKKLAIIENKLNGMNPINIMLDEFLESSIYHKPMTKEIINEILYGSDPDSTRVRNKRNMYLDVETQVDALNEQAIDQNLLGRMWLGWSPFL